jgi:DNA-binding MltR family transcriptional regulator
VFYLDKELHSRFWDILNNEKYNYTFESDSLLVLVKELKDQGKSQREVYNIFGELLDEVVEKGTEEQDDWVRDIMDIIVGWCCESYWIWDTPLYD